MRNIRPGILLALFITACVWLNSAKTSNVFGQVPAAPPAPSRTVETRLDRIEELLQKLAGGQRTTSAKSRLAGARLQQDALFQLPENLPRRQISSETSGGAPVAGDRDRDGLTDAEEVTLGADPDNPDTDGDALLDGWEVQGVNGIDLHSLGASPLHKDIFVEMDYMARATATNDLKPSDNVMRGIEAVFANALVANPDSSMGIRIHLELGNQVPYDDDLKPYFTEFAQLKKNNFNPSRAPVFHYMIWANAYGGGTSSGISLDIPHSDFIVTLGSWNSNRGGTDQQKLGTFIHELGHNVGRMHGGSEHVNYKPNHLSVMNYNFQTRGILLNGVRVFDYQRFPMPRLEEGTLRETDGLAGSSMLHGYATIFFTPGGVSKEVPCDGAIDWNYNGAIDATDAIVDLNRDTLLDELLATPNEWEQLIYNGGALGKLGALTGVLEKAREQYEVPPFIELTEEQDQQIDRSITEGLSR